MITRKSVRKKLGWGYRKYCLWLRIYLKRVKMVERELGGELAAC